MSPWRRRLVLAAATVGFISWPLFHIVPLRKWKGGGLLGTLAGWGLLWVVPRGLWQGVVLLVLLITSVPLCTWAERELTYDDPRIVLDEVVGVWVAAFALPKTWGVLLAAFLLFRIFDVWKSYPLRQAARLPEGWGIVADDVLAGLMANGLIRAWLAWGR